MRYSKLFGKTRKYVKELESKNATLLSKAGFIDQTMSGVYKFLPLGFMVLKKIENIIREEMNKLGQEMLLSALSPVDLWIKTKRDKIDVLFEAKGANENSLKRNSNSYILNPTHEDNITPMVKQFVRSYKQLPIGLYQFQLKFRNEERAKSGLLRCREFIMKDLYSFHVNKEDLIEYYEKVKNAYTTIFNRVGLGNFTYITLASGGDFTKNYTHEFQVKCKAGEDTIFKNKKGICYNKEIAPSRANTPKQEIKIKNKEKVLTKNIKTVEELSKFLGISKDKCVKTILYTTEKGFFAVAIRGDYEINEIKLKKVLEVKNIRLASNEEIIQLTKTETGFMGPINLPEDRITLIFDDSVENLVNFECGANETNYHYINVNWNRDLKKPEKFYDIKQAKEGDLDPETLEPYEVFKAAEVGNIFQLDTKFSEAFDFKYTDKNGKENIVYMGSYGIGLTRLIGVIAEVFSDEKGLIWPENIAPFKYHLIHITNKKNDIQTFTKAEFIYNEMLKKGIEVLFDDRIDVSTGEKFSDADLIGIPYRVVVSTKLLKENKIEIKKRDKDQIEIIDINYFLNSIN